ncbi:MAG: Hsp20/alpha crystallin family protein [Chloroflexi bacterium]|jgi:HSP20 family protein|nr:Hsp20/alpha crystallin family protein [Chloroflexota bacterium]
MARNTKQQNTAVVARRPEERYLPLSQVIDRLFQESFLPQSMLDGFGPRFGSDGTNLWETGDRYIVQLAMPGVNPGSISCRIEQNVLICTGESALQPPKDATPIWEALGGNVEHRIELPTEVDPGKAEATYEHGVLTVTVPKAAHVRAHSIKVTAK